MVETRSQARRRHRDEVDVPDAAAVHVEGVCAHNHGDNESDCCSDPLDDIETSDDDDGESETGRIPSAKRVHLNPVPGHRSVVSVVARGFVLACALVAVYLTSRVAYRAWSV